MSSSSSVWQEVPEAPKDPILGLNEMFREDPAPNKVNLGVGAFRTDENRPYVLPVVKRVEAEMASDPATIHEYLPIEGLPDFCRLSAALLFGRDARALREQRVVTVQSLSGTGSLRVAAEFLARFYCQQRRRRRRRGAAPSASDGDGNDDDGAPPLPCYIPDPTWGNHKNIFPRAGIETRQYRYYDAKTRGVDLDGMLADLDAAPPGSIIVLHACAHNPTGADPTLDQWRRILEVVRARRHLPLFDTAYQGFASGDLEADAAAVRLFADARAADNTSNMEMVVTQSFAKNMGLYGERVGALNFVCATPDVHAPVLSQLKQVVRAMYSNPPAHGARIAARILADARLFAEWQRELQMMSGRIMHMRRELKRALEANGTPGRWDHVLTQIGMFSFTGLTPEQVRYLRDKYHIYMTLNGRMSMAGLTSHTVQYLADAMKDAVVNVGNSASHL